MKGMPRKADLSLWLKSVDLQAGDLLEVLLIRSCQGVVHMQCRRGYQRINGSQAVHGCVLLQ